MLQIIGIILLISGTTGVAWNYCKEQKERLGYLKAIRQIYEYLRKEIDYAKASLPELCGRIGQRQPPPFGEAFAAIYEELNENNGCPFNEIWEKHMMSCMKGLPLKNHEKALISGFTLSLGFRDGKGQAEGMEQYVEEVSQYIKNLEEELKNKYRVVMCMGVMSGIMAVILLL